MKIGYWNGILFGMNKHYLMEENIVRLQNKLIESLKCMKSAYGVVSVLGLLFIFGICIYTTVEGSMLYGTDSDFFYIVRYLSYSILGVGAAFAGMTIPFDKLASYWNKKIEILTTACIGVVLLVSNSDKIQTLIRQVPYWLNPSLDPDGASYVYFIKNENLDIIRWIGKSEVEVSQSMIQERIVDYVIATIGIIPTFIIFVLLISLLVSFIRKVHSLDKSCSRFISVWILLYFGINMVSNLLFAFNLSPVFPTHFIFVSCDMVYQLIDGLFIGILIAIYYKEIEVL